MKRDKTIDFLRGAVMLYIIFVIHGFGIVGAISYYSIPFSLLLFEMPLIFFISGASLKLSSSKSFGVFLKSRLYRVVVPYIVWATIAFAIFGILRVSSAKSIIMNLLFFRAYHPIPFTYHMWFVIPYLLVSIMGYWLLKGYKKWSSMFIAGYTILLAAVVFLLDLSHVAVPFSYQVRYTIVYSAFYVMGFWYHDKLKKLYLVIIIGILTVCYLWLLHTHTYSLYTQVNKFPPNFAFLCYGSIVVLFLLVLLSYMKQPVTKDTTIISFANKYGYEMYLYQNYSLWISSIFLATPLMHSMHWSVRYLSVIAMTSCVLFPIAKLMNSVDNKLCMVLNK